MKRFVAWIRSLRRPWPWIVGGLLTILIVLATVTVSATAWEYTNSPQFCGTTCHTMPPEYLAYQVSPHARVACVDCHLGQDSILLTVPRKAREISHVVNALTKAYEPPIYVKNLRPARDTCEQCHNPDKFSSDTFVEIKRYASDELNTHTRNYMVIKTGGGSLREGLGRGIHWHIESQVYYYTDDRLKQTIPYVKEVAPDGKVTEFFDTEAGLPPDFGKQVESQLRRMDCIDCHTRISHLFRSPSNAMDEALARGLLDSSMPYIKSEGTKILSQEYPSLDAGMKAVEDLEGWYKTNEPTYYAANTQKVQQAVIEIKGIFSQTVFPNLKVGWQTHPDNAGHREFPGCFRCHDGKHVSPQGQTVRLECNLCHSIPEVVASDDAAPVLSVDKPGEPESHKDSNWIARHRFVFDASCAGCHNVTNPGGTDNSSFCSNSACHASEWKFVGLNAPAVRQLVAPPPVPGSGQPRPVPHPIGERTDCLLCHALNATVRPFPENHAAFDRSLCTQCHQSASSDASGQPNEPTATTPPLIPHSLEGRRDQCLTCHGETGFKPYPTNHKGRATDTCLACHKTAADSGVTPTATAAPEPAATVTVTPTESATTVTVTPTESAATVTVTPTEPTTTVTVTPTQSAGGPPPIPHALEGREGQCLVCHAIGSVKPFPENHAGRTAESCTACHKPQS